ncbi:flagellar export chaperone FliS [Clostridium paraputrificum]|uniref:flagellar export chaperone FliS n=1 Tax=Clostridium paraputrificum TaxID=29363 RepID=UPI00325BC819
MYNSGYNAYKNNSVNYASKEQLLLMLVDGAVKYAKIGRAAIEEKNVTKAHESLTRTQDIFVELMASLDKGAGEWAKQIFKVYEFINYKVGQANLKKDIKEIDEVIPFIEDIRNMWYEVYEKTKASGQ